MMTPYEARMQRVAEIDFGRRRRDKAHEKRERKKLRRLVMQIWEQLKRGDIETRPAVTRIGQLMGLD